eukprot:8586286-Lingulodinium_polyedra.AAC.1
MLLQPPRWRRPCRGLCYFRRCSSRSCVRTRLGALLPGGAGLPLARSSRLGSTTGLEPGFCSE